MLARMRLASLVTTSLLATLLSSTAQAAAPAPAAGASASTTADEDEDEEPPRAEDAFGHQLQVGVRGSIVGGYRMVMRYDDSPFCAPPEATNAQGQPLKAKEQKKLCGHGAPLALDLALSFAPFDSLEPYLWTRLGLAAEDATDTERQLAFGAGVRIYTMSDSAFKIFVQPAVGMSVEGSKGTPAYGSEATAQDPTYHPEWKKELLFQLSAGPQYDFAKYVGVYAHAGMTLGILRALAGSFELGAGLQLRL